MSKSFVSSWSKLCWRKARNTRKPPRMAHWIQRPTVSLDRKRFVVCKTNRSRWNSPRAMFNWVKQRCLCASIHMIVWKRIAYFIKMPVPRFFNPGRVVWLSNDSFSLSKMPPKLCKGGIVDAKAASAGGVCERRTPETCLPMYSECLFRGENTTAHEKVPSATKAWSAAATFDVTWQLSRFKSTIVDLSTKNTSNNCARQSWPCNVAIVCALPRQN
mmetsp:Transcript_14608/g.31892  ORF Transcript_14608/g.31892 Transcript_14608/m.31892 type:complete len:216 (-) Transcript_14608:1949-2596(-)